MLLGDNQQVGGCLRINVTKSNHLLILMQDFTAYLVKIKCFITGKLRNDTPEEKVRQDVARSLVEEYGYDKKDIDIEFPVKMGRARKRSDIVVFYDIEFRQQGRKFEADIKEDGTIHNWEREITVGDLPEVVMSVVANKYPESTITEIMAITAVTVGTEALEGYEIILETADIAFTNGPMVAPKHQSRFVFPALKEIVDYCHSRGIPCLKHTDGNIWALMDLIVEAGFDGIHPIDPVAGMDIGEAKDKYGEKLCIMGNVDCGNLLSWGSKEEVRETVKDCIRKAGKGGGYICMSGNSIHGAVSPDNYAEMIRAIREYGKYPLNLA